MGILIIVIYQNIIKKANQYKITYTMVTNKEYNSEIGLVLAHEDAVDKENIYVTHENTHFRTTSSNAKTKQKKNFLFFKKIRF